YLLRRRYHRPLHLPYPTLFRSRPTSAAPMDAISRPARRYERRCVRRGTRRPWSSPAACTASSRPSACSSTATPTSSDSRGRASRSEEHTSELQSRENLVCRLLL